MLARTGLGRHDWETLEEHATRLVTAAARPTVASVLDRRSGRTPGTDGPGRRALEAYRALAALAARASYAPDPCTEADVAEARRLSDELRTALRPLGAARTARRLAPVGSRPSCADASISTLPRPSWPACSTSSWPPAWTPRGGPAGTSPRPPAPRHHRAPSPHRRRRAAEDTAGSSTVLRWGLVPHWAKDPRTGYKMINARAETVTKNPAYRSAFAAHRCLVVVDGFFEWQVPDPESPKRKVPFYFRRADGRPLTFAGLYETWWDKSPVSGARPRDDAAHVHHHHHQGRRRHGRRPQPHAVIIERRRHRRLARPRPATTPSLCRHCPPRRPAAPWSATPVRPPR